MVTREEIPVNIKDARAMIISASIVKNESGAWTLVFEVDGAIDLKDGRTIKADGELRIRGRQRGRKERAA